LVDENVVEVEDPEHQLEEARVDNEGQRHDLHAEVDVFGLVAALGGLVLDGEGRQQFGLHHTLLLAAGVHFHAVAPPEVEVDKQLQSEEEGGHAHGGGEVHEEFLQTPLVLAFVGHD